MSQIPISKGSVFNTGVAANTNIFSSDLSPTNTPTKFQVYTCFDDAGILTVKRTVSGATIDEKLNNGAALTADSPYIEDIIVDEDETINLQYSVKTTILKLSVVEIPNMY